MKQELKEVDWSRSYPVEIKMITAGVVLRQKEGEVRLLYDVYLEKGDRDKEELIGTCHILESVSFPCEKKRFVAKELEARSPELTKRLEDIQQMVQNCL